MPEKIEAAMFTGASGTALIVLQSTLGLEGNLLGVQAIFCPRGAECQTRRFDLGLAFLESAGPARSRACTLQAARHWVNAQAWGSSPATAMLVPVDVAEHLKPFEELATGKPSPVVAAWLAPSIVDAPALLEHLSNSSLPVLEQDARVVLAQFKHWREKASTE